MGRLEFLLGAEESADPAVAELDEAVLEFMTIIKKARKKERKGSVSLWFGFQKTNRETKICINKNGVGWGLKGFAFMLIFVWF